MGSVLGSLGGGGGLGAMFGQAQQGAGGGGGGGLSDIIGRAFGGLGNRTPLVNPRPPMGTMSGFWGGQSGHDDQINPRLGPQQSAPGFGGLAGRFGQRFGQMQDQNQWRAPQMSGSGQLSHPKIGAIGNQVPTIPDSPISNAYGGMQRQLGGMKRRPGGESPWAV